MKTIRSGKRLRSDGGQVTITVVLAMGIFLLGAMGFAVDMANLWFHRQSAQIAADAACTAGGVGNIEFGANLVTLQHWFHSHNRAIYYFMAAGTGPLHDTAL